MYLPRLAESPHAPPHSQRGFCISIERIAEEIRFHYEALSTGQVRAALEYWYEHRAEIQDELDEEDIAAIHSRPKYSRLP